MHPGFALTLGMWLFFLACVIGQLPCRLGSAEAGTNSEFHSLSCFDALVQRVVDHDHRRHAAGAETTADIEGEKPIRVVWPTSIPSSFFSASRMTLPLRT